MSASDSIQSRFLKLPIDRRSMIKTVAAGSAAGLIASGAPGAASAAPAAQTTGTTLTGSFYQTIPNPWQMSGNGLWTSLVFERLVSWNETYSEVIPALAESWTTSDDGLVYTFKLRSGITWHDETPFTADDIVWSYITLLNPAITGTWVLPNLNPIKGAVAYKTGGATELPAVKALDELTVEITVEAPSPLIISQLAMPFILPKHLLENVPAETLFDDPYFTDSLVGLGPYKFQEWERDQFQTVVKYDGYYRGAPKIDTIVARFYETPSVAILAQQNNEVDAILLLSPDDIETVKADAKLDVFPGPAMLEQSLGVGNKIEQLKDKRVRQAFLYAIDRKTIIDTLYKGAATVVNTPFLAEWVPMDGINPYEYDPEKAKALLTEAGWPSDATLDVWAYYTDNFTGQLLAAFQQYLGDVGVKTAVQQTEFANMEADYNAGNFGLIYQGSSVGPDPDAMYIYFHSKSEYNTLYSDPKVDELLDAGRVALDQAERAQIYHELAIALNDQSFWLALWTPLRHWAVTKNVSGVNGNMGTPGLHIPFYTKAETWTKS
jgi:peptide/nickel transport system substrate-binding protein